MLANVHIEVVVVGILEWGVAAYHLEDQNAECPEINALVVANGVDNLTIMSTTRLWRAQRLVKSSAFWCTNTAVARNDYPSQQHHDKHKQAQCRNTQQQRVCVPQAPYTPVYHTRCRCDP